MYENSKKCPYCAEEVLLDAKKCKHCGEMIGELPMSSFNNLYPHAFRVRLWSPGIAAVLSLFIPGAGHLYKNLVSNGLIWLFCTALGYYIWVPIGVVLHIICIVKAAQGDPFSDPLGRNLTNQIIQSPPKTILHQPEMDPSTRNVSTQMDSKTAAPKSTQHEHEISNPDFKKVADQRSESYTEATTNSLIIFGVISFLSVLYILFVVFKR